MVTTSITPLLAVAIALASAVGGTAAAQVTVPTVPPRAEDVASIDGIIKAFYDVISGPAGQPRQWARDRTLYIAGVKFVSLDVREGRPVASVMDHQQFVDRTDAGFMRDGFFEREVHRVTHRFGNFAHVFSTYEMRRTPDGAVFGRGVNSIELFWDGARWWIAAAVWDDERPDNPIPRELLP